MSMRFTLPVAEAALILLALALTGCRGARKAVRFNDGIPIYELGECGGGGGTSPAPT
jgi:hypothetical protein